MSQNDKAAIRKQFQRHDRDTGSSEVQIAVLTKSIEHLTEHLKKNKNHIVTEDMIARLASRSAGMSPANLASVMELANRMAVKAQKPLDNAILDEAYELTKHGAKKDWGYEYLERVRIHRCNFRCWIINLGDEADFS